MFQFLRSPTSTLEVLDLHDIGMNNHAINALTTALAGNTKLKELNLEENRD